MSFLSEAYEFVSQAEAFRKTKVSQSKISEVCNGNRLTAGGFFGKKQSKSKFKDLKGFNKNKCQIN